MAEILHNICATENECSTYYGESFDSSSSHFRQNLLFCVPTWFLFFSQIRVCTISLLLNIKKKQNCFLYCSIHISKINFRQIFQQRMDEGTRLILLIKTELMWACDYQSVITASFVCCKGKRDVGCDEQMEASKSRVSIACLGSHGTRMIVPWFSILKRFEASLQIKRWRNS